MGITGTPSASSSASNGTRRGKTVAVVVEETAVEISKDESHSDFIGSLSV